MKEDAYYQFWQDLPDDLDPAEIGEMTYNDGITAFPLEVLTPLWLKELGEVGLSKVDGSTGIPQKAESPHTNQWDRPLEGDVRPVTLGESRKGAWIRFDGPRTERGYAGIDVLAEPLRTETAIVAALTVLEASLINEEDFERLREALLRHVDARPELEGVKLQELLAQLPGSWFYAQMKEIDVWRKHQLEELTALPTDEREKARKKLNLNGPEKRDRNAGAWRRSLEYQLALLRHRRPDFDDLDLDEQLMLIGNFRRHVYDFLEAQRALTQFLEYGIPEGTPNSVVRNARDQVRAAVLADVEGLTHRKIALKLGVEIPKTYAINMKIPVVKRMVEDGRGILNEALGAGEWSQKAEEIKSDGEHYLSLDDREKVAEELVRRRGLSRETACHIRFSAEALRTDPRRSQRVSEVCSPSILNLVKSLVSPTSTSSGPTTPTEASVRVR